MGLKPLIEKYSTSGPRYTSYPTAPQWTEAIGEADYARSLAKLSGQEEGMALYAHIPFCEQLCYYCGCNIQLTKDHAKGGGYVHSLLKEIRKVASHFSGKPRLSQISWGGGTPTFLSLSEISDLHKGTREAFEVLPGAEVSIEIDPRVTSLAQLELLRELGFNRVSLGVQDFNLDVQKAVNRIQSAQMTREMLEASRQMGYQGVNFDLIYGLPNQTLSTFEKTVEEVIEIRPDRIALYNYAHLPSLRPHQKILEKYPMPGADERTQIFTSAYERLSASGYHSIGMDHFALETDELYKALTDGRLHRNFMGYTVKKGTALLGVGASAIGDLGDAYFQNVRETKPYEDKIGEGSFATLRGCLLSQDDRERQWVIQSLMCRFRLNAEEFETKFGGSFEGKFQNELPKLKPFFDEGILAGKPSAVTVTDLGRLFLRNVAMLFDAYLAKPSSATYSKTV